MASESAPHSADLSLAPRKFAVVVMARAPLPDAKTRLNPILSPEQRAGLVSAMLEDELETICRLASSPAFRPDGSSPAGFPSADSPRLMLACAPDVDYPLFASMAMRYGCERMPQGEGDLGQRMARAIETTLGRGFAGVLVIGSDSPTLPLEVLEQAVRALETADVVFGPAFDGGYYLVGMKRLESSLFAGVPWSGPEVLAVSLDRARAAGLRAALLPSWYDVDVSEDLERLREHARVIAAAGEGGLQAGWRTVGLVEGWMGAR